jgi:hypothetical protein
LTSLLPKMKGRRKMSLEQGRNLRDEGMDRVQRAEDARWKFLFNATAEGFARSLTPFQPDDVIDIVGMPRRPNVIGALINALVRRGTITAVGTAQSRRAKSHARRKTVYRGR